MSAVTKALQGYPPTLLAKMGVLVHSLMAAVGSFPPSPLPRTSRWSLSIDRALGFGPVMPREPRRPSTCGPHPHRVLTPAQSLQGPQHHRY
ncbi:uncharacterized protein GGS25DRAFT_519733 [Hypoxylon fragiforme]|uniref:uncharacterized protein n=1 Tax=Hypoxylon fragiforme TaxID=63214 RepID=UPI0020C6CBA8|nr:uncharacterized protein GGS25DRAFT_519733 [Hypoxylon fragiforme]KAI2611425.1 hypothetical protein GGS25DRAFT_519733 [Hypoxylon fragiforme]